MKPRKGESFQEPKKWIPKRSGNPWEKYLAEFASAMASVMEQAMQKGGDRSPTPWKYDSDFLRRRLIEEYLEWEEDTPEVESAELLDIANFCYFLWVRLNKVRQEEVKKSE